MIVPRNRLLFAVGAIVLPFAVVGVLERSALAVSLGMIVLTVVAALLDAALSLGRLRGLNFELPEIVRLTKDRQGNVPVTIKNESRATHQLRIGLAFPREIVLERPDLETTVPADAPVAEAVWPVTPIRRGSYILERIYVETPSMLGLWGIRGVRPVRSELRVYPNIFGERKRLAAIFLNRGAFGVHGTSATPRSWLARRAAAKSRSLSRLM